MPILYSLLFRLLLLMFCVGGVLHATPERKIYSFDRLLCSNETSYAILRTTYDNIGSNENVGTHHSVQIDQSLLVFSKQPEDPKRFNQPGPMLSKTQLLEYTHITDASMVPEGKSPRKFHKQDDSMTLAKLLRDYPMMPIPWSKEQIDKLEQDPTSGIMAPGVSLVWGGWVKEQFGVHRNSEFEWDLDGVMQDGNAIYLQVSGSGDDGGQRIFALSPRKTRQVLAHQSRQPLYLTAGTHDTLEDAMKQARSLKKGREFILGFEVWSMRLPTDQTKYVVVDVNSTKHLRKPGMAALEKRTDIELTVVASDRFVERFEVKPGE